MMRSIFTFLLILNGLYLQAQVSVAWSNFPGGVSVALDNADNVYSVWWVYNPAGDIYLNKRDADGNIIWEEKFDNTDNTRHEVATWVAVDNENNILVSGTIRSGYASPVNAASVLMKFDPDGNLIWRTVYDTDFDGSYTVKCVVDASNNIYVLGRNGGPAVTEVNKFNSDGDMLWTFLDEDGIGNPLNIKLTPDNHVVISGRWLYGSGGGYAKIDADGNKIWGWADYALTPGDVAGDVFGNSYIVHGQYDFDYGIYLIKMDDVGNIIWQEEHPMSAYRVEVGTDNNPVVCGFPSSGSVGAAFAKYDADGNLLWQNLDADGPSYGILSHAMMLMDNDNNAYVAGSIMTAMAVCKVDADGNSVWTLTMGTGYSAAIALGSDNSVYVTGGTTAKILQEPPVEVCEIPTGLATSVEINKAKAKWDFVTDAYQYEFSFKKVSAGGWKTKLVPGTTNKVTIKNLNLGTDYVWRVRTICAPGDPDAVSDYAPLQYFSTPLRSGIVTEVEKIMILYPNPAQDYIQLDYNLSESATFASVQITNMQGQVVWSNVFPEGMQNNLRIDIQQLPSGVYHLQLIADDWSDTQQFIKQ